jgi:hypothetical protein
VADADRDGDLDIFSAYFNDEGVAWYENSGAAQPVWTQRTVTNTTDDPWSVFPADLDHDGDIDVLSPSAEDDTVA